MSDAAAWERALESIGAVAEKCDRIEDGQQKIGAAVMVVDRKLSQHVADDDKRFSDLRRKDALIAAKVEGVKEGVKAPPFRAPFDSAHELEAVKVKEENTTKREVTKEENTTRRWQIAASIIGGLLALVGAVLAGRASAPATPSIPYAVPAVPSSGGR